MNTKDQLTVLIIVTAIVGSFIALLVHGKLIQDEQNAQLVDHLHVRLLIFNDGVQAKLPAGIGISQELWTEHTLDQYGIGGVAPLHTHFDDSIIHVEANVHREWTLGEFLDIWGQDANGLVFTDCAGDPCIQSNLTDYRDHALQDGETLRIERGTAVGPKPA